MFNYFISYTLQDEEVRFTDKIIEAFNAGTLELPEEAAGTTLRSFLSDKLGCDPMRITKKYTGASCLGKRVYHAGNIKAPREVIEETQKELTILEAKFREKLEKTSRDRLGLEVSYLRKIFMLCDFKVFDIYN